MLPSEGSFEASVYLGCRVMTDFSKVQKNKSRLTICLIDKRWCLKKAILCETVWNTRGLWEGEFFGNRIEKVLRERYCDQLRMHCKSANLSHTMPVFTAPDPDDQVPESIVSLLIELKLLWAPTQAASSRAIHKHTIIFCCMMVCDYCFLKRVEFIGRVEEVRTERWWWTFSVSESKNTRDFLAVLGDSSVRCWRWFGWIEIERKDEEMRLSLQIVWIVRSATDPQVWSCWNANASQSDAKRCCDAQH